MRILTTAALLLALAAALFAVGGNYGAAKQLAGCALAVGGFRAAYGWLADARTPIEDVNEG